MSTFEKAKIRTEKEKARKAKNKNRKKWWIIKFDKYEFGFWLLPLAVFVIPFGKIKDALHKSIKWSDEKATKVLDKKLPKILKWDDENKNYYCYIRIFGWGLFSNPKSPWVKKYNYNLRDFLVKNYENENYIKTVEEDYDWYYITFTEKLKQFSKTP